MAEEGLETLLSALDIEPPRGATGTPTDGAVLSVSCPLAGCDHDPAWLTEGLSTHVGVTTLGNRTWERRDDDRDLQESIRAAVDSHAVEAIIVVGHTDCDVLADAYDRALGTASPAAAGVQASLAPLEAVVSEAIESAVVDPETPRRRARQRLVEYNVVRNVSFLRSRLPSTTVAGVVTDQAGVYGSFPGKQYLVALDEATDPAELRARLPEDAQLSVDSLLSAASTR